MSALTAAIQHYTGSPRQCNKARKRFKGIHTGKEKPPVFTDDTTVYIENPRESIKKLLKLGEFSQQVTVYKVNTQKSIALLHSTNNGKLKKNF